ncbi:Vacuolar protein sorting-associated protein 29 [Nakaseomyces bracarensis]|uniref:Vacuolar protein sorting-associated protein 29 n=1 Tax=Nakaseomyces bracarensis TaxID=273131 RepID=A0ABR4NPP7_9SACH
MLVLALSDAHIPDRAVDLPSKFKKLMSIPDKISQVAVLGNSSNSAQFLKFVTDITSNVHVVRGEFDNASIPVVQPARVPIFKSGATDKIERPTRVELPLNTVFTQGDFKIGCCSGYTVVPKNDPLSLLALARQLDVDILLWGGTYNVEAYTLEGKFFINPGSCTGAYNTDYPVFSDILGNTQKDEKEKENTEEQLNKGQLESKKELLVSDLDLNGSNVPSFCLLDIQGPTCTLYIYLFVDGDVKVDKVVFEKQQ